MLITNFSSGELSPNLNGRIDLQQYYQGASKLQNFEIIPTGGIQKRVGTKRMVAVPGNARIIPFILDKNRSFVFVFTKNAVEDETCVIKVYQFTTGGNLTLLQNDIPTSYMSIAECNELQYAQNYDRIVFVHRSYKPFELKFVTGNTNTFTYSEMHFDFYPDVTLDDDYDFIMIPSDTLPVSMPTPDGHLKFSYNRASGTSYIPTVKDFEGGIKTVYCVLKGKLYEYDATNGWQPSKKDFDQDEMLFNEEGKYPGCVTYFNNRLWFASSGINRQRVWASATPDTKDTRYNDFCLYKKYVTVNKVVKEADLHVFTCDLLKANINITAGTTTLTNVTQDFTVQGLLQNPLTDYYVSGPYIPVGTKVVSVTANTIVLNTKSIDIDNDKTNLVCSIQLWKNADSVTAEDYEYSVTSQNVTTEDCGFFFDLASNENDAIMFMSANSFLAVGTECSIWSVGADVSALNISARMQGRYGSDELQGLGIEQATIYFAQGKKGIREFYYDSEGEAFRTNNIAILADHVLMEASAVDFDYLSNPYSRLIVCRSDGQLVTLLYDKNNGVMGWNRLKHGNGLFRNVAVVRGYDQWDIVFFLVQQGEDFYIEMLDPEQEMYLDSWKTYPAEDGEYTEEAVLFNETKNDVCSASDIPVGFIDEGDVVYIGYMFESDIISMPVIAGDPSAKRRITHLQVRFLDSYFPVMKCTGVTDERFTGIAAPYSGIRKITYPGASDNDVNFELYSKDAKRVKILSVDAVLA